MSVETVEPRTTKEEMERRVGPRIIALPGKRQRRVIPSLKTAKSTSGALITF